MGWDCMGQVANTEFQDLGPEQDLLDIYRMVFLPAECTWHLCHMDLDRKDLEQCNLVEVLD